MVTRIAREKEKTLFPENKIMVSPESIEMEIVIVGAVWESENFQISKRIATARIVFHVRFLSNLKTNSYPQHRQPKIRFFAKKQRNLLFP